MSDRKAQFRLCLAQLSPSMFMLLTVFTMFLALNTSSGSFNTTYFIRLLLLILLVSKVSLNVTSYILVFICRCSVNFMLFLIYFDGPMINLNQIHNVLYEFTMPLGCYFTFFALTAFKISQVTIVSQYFFTQITCNHNFFSFFNFTVSKIN